MFNNVEVEKLLPTYHQYEPFMLEPHNYIASGRGKKTLPSLVKGWNQWFNIPEEYVSLISDITHMLSNSLLMIDDIQDGSALRRGKPTAHRVYGVPFTFNTSAYVFFKVQQVIMTKFPARLVEPALRLYTDVMLNGHLGQGMDIYWRDNFICPSEEEYKDIARLKTGSVADLLMGMFGLFNPDVGDRVDIASLSRAMGIFFQIRDDYCNLVSDVYHQAKSFAEDLTEGKWSFPVIHCVHNSSEVDRKTLLDILKSHPTDEDVKRKAIQIMEKSGSLDYTMREGERYHRLVLQEVGKVTKISGRTADIILSVLDSYSIQKVGTENEVRPDATIKLPNLNIKDGNNNSSPSPGGIDI